MADDVGGNARPQTRHTLRSRRAPEVSASRDRLRALLDAQSAVAAELDLPAVLRRLVLVARELVHARYAAVGVLGEGGVFDEFVYTGMDPATVERIGHLPEGHGVLGLLSSHSAPVRLAELRADPAFNGFPPHHPMMDGFLGVPIRIRGDRVFGNLYLTDSANGEFSDEDEQLVVSLAGAAAVAIDNARLRQEAGRLDRWSAASVEVVRQLLAHHGDHSLDLVLRHARRVASADFATVALLVEPARLEVKAAVGAMAEHLVGLTVGTDGSVAGQVARTRTPVLTAGSVGTVDGVLPARAGSVVIVPLTAGGTVKGTLNIGRVVGAPAFTAAETSQLAGFAGQVGVAMELDRASRSDQLINDDHDRIGTELNEHVIQALYAVALSLQGLVSITTQPGLQARLSRCIDRLDVAIERIRSTVYDLTVAPRRQDDLHHRLLAVVDEHAPVLGLPVGIRFTGLFINPLPPDLAEEVLTVVGDTMTDIARHSGTSDVQLRVDITEDLVLVEIISDGRGIESSARTDLLTALRRRASAHAGSLRYSTPSTGGSHLMWTAHTHNGVRKTS